MDAIANQLRVHVLRITRMAAHATKNEAMTTEASLVQEAQDCMSSEGSSEESSHCDK